MRERERENLSEHELDTLRVTHPVIEVGIQKLETIIFALLIWGHLIFCLKKENVKVYSLKHIKEKGRIIDNHILL